jgi:hypothetical protein
MKTFFRPYCSKSLFNSAARTCSLNGGAGIAQMRACKSTISGSLRRTASRAALMVGSFFSTAGSPGAAKAEAKGRAREQSSRERRYRMVGD